MKMTVRRTQILSVMLACLLSLFAWQRWVHVQQEETNAQRSALLFAPMTVAEITAIELTNASGGLRIERTAQEAHESSQWRIVQPIAVAADEEAVMTLLEQMLAAPLRPIADVTPTLCGLEPLRYRLRLVSATGTAAADFGMRSAFSDELYARMPAGTVGLTRGSLVYQLERNVYQLRDKRLLRVAPDAVRRITIVTTDRVSLDAAQSASLLAELANVRAQRFVTETPSAEEFQNSGLARPSLQVELELEDNSTRALRFAAAAICRAAVMPQGPIMELTSCRIIDELRTVVNTAAR